MTNDTMTNEGPMTNDQWGGLRQLLSMKTHAPIYGPKERRDERAATPFRVDGIVLLVLPRVARSSAFAGLRRDESQPWAERCNPFGIEGKLDIGHWILVIHWSLVIGHWSFSGGHWPSSLLTRA